MIYILFYYYEFSLSFPKTAITDYHKLCGLKLQQYILLQLWRSKIHSQDVRRAMFLLQILGSCLFQLLLALRVLGACITNFPLPFSNDTSHWF